MYRKGSVPQKNHRTGGFFIPARRVPGGEKRLVSSISTDIRTFRASDDVIQLPMNMHDSKKSLILLIRISNLMVIF